MKGRISYILLSTTFYNGTEWRKQIDAGNITQIELQYNKLRVPGEPAAAVFMVMIEEDIKRAIMLIEQAKQGAHIKFNGICLLCGTNECGGC